MGYCPGTLVDLDNGNVLSSDLQVASTFWSRLVGLMGRTRLLDGEGLLLTNCPSVHTCFMRFAIDVAYLDSEMRVVAVYPAVSPWRMVRKAPKAAHTFEVAAGTLTAAGTHVGHRLAVSFK